MTDKVPVGNAAVAVAENQDGEVGNHGSGFQYLMNSPGYMTSAVHRQLLQEMLKGLPANVRKRINALRNIELERLHLEAKYFEESYALERKYQQLYQPLYDKRRDVVTGTVEPTDKDTIWPYEITDEDLTPDVQAITKELRKNLQLNYPDDVRGVPDFWLTIFRNTETLSSMLQAPDEPALRKLIDIKIVYEEEPMSYTLEFHFEPNEYFTNTVLTKQYFLKSKVDAEFPFTFEGPEIFKCVGCNIEWQKGKNLTVKTIKRKQKHKARGAVRTVTKQVPADSFFNFFNPPQIQDEDKVDIDVQSILSTDFEIGHFLRARIIPKAALYYTGDIVEGDDDDDDYDEEEEEEEEECEEEESGEEESPPSGSKQRGGHGPGGQKKKGPPDAANANAPAECKQQ